MKIFFFTFLIVLSLSAVAQQKDVYPQDGEKKHELSINAFTLVAFGWLEFSYDYLINEGSSFGVDLQFGLDSNNPDLNPYRTFSIIPNYRHFFSNKYARGFYVETFAMVHSYSYEEYFYTFNNSFTNIQKETNLSLGVSVGGKWVTKRGFIADVFLGIGRKLLNSDEIDVGEVVARGGISLGYRF